MARLLTDSDIYKLTLSDSVLELITSNLPQWKDAEQVAQAEMASRLSQRYIVSSIFTNTSLFDKNISYKAKNLVYYSEPDFNEAATYTGYPQWDSLTFYPSGNFVNHKGISYQLNNFGGNQGTEPGTNPMWVSQGYAPRVNWKGKIYEAIGTASGILPSNTTYWQYICEDNQMFYVTLPNNEWNKATVYSAGDVVWFGDKNYTAVVGNTNIKPDTNSGIWGSGVSYSVSAGTLPTDTAYWTLGDNRNPLIVRFLLDITAYHFMRSVPARAIPDHIKEAYNGNDAMDRGGALGWLNSVASGDFAADLPEIYSTAQMSITYGSARPKQSNFLW